MRSKLYASFLTIGFLLLVVFSGPNLANAQKVSDDLNRGPYVDKLVYKCITREDDRALELQAGTIDMDVSSFSPPLFPLFDQDPDISIFEALRNGYGNIIINCRDYPLNISGLRQAFALAFDKARVKSEVFSGFARLHDSVVPYPSPWCIEDELPWHYYNPEIAIGNNILDELNFTVDGGSGFRLAPNGSAFNIVIEYPSSSPLIGAGVAQIGVDALRALGINAETLAVDYNEYAARLANHGKYDMAVDMTNFDNYDVDWLAYDYWSEYAGVPYQNPSNFVNETYDAWRYLLLNGITYEEVYEAAAEMQKILAYNVPILVTYEDTYLQAYRVDQFTSYVPDACQYISGEWTMRKIHKLDGSLGGTVSVAIAQDVDSFNFFVANSPFAKHLLRNVHASLYKQGPDVTIQADLAQSLLVETHADNSTVPAGHTRFTIDIIQNATWSDGVPLTAEDVAFTYNYTIESGVFGNPAANDFNNLTFVNAPSQYRVVLEFETESYWIFKNFAYNYIIPKHIFNNTSGIGYAGWNTWNPVLDPTEPDVTCGPFKVTEFQLGEFYELTKNSYYHWLPDAPLNPPPQVSSLGYIEYEEGTEGNEIVWYASDDNPIHYEVYKNGLRIISLAWDGNNIHIDIDGLSEGLYNYTLILMDNSLNTASDTVWVNVTASVVTTPTTPTPPTTTNTPSPTTESPTIPTTEPGDTFLDLVIIVVSGGSTIFILIVIILIFRSKRS